MAAFREVIAASRALDGVISFDIARPHRCQHDHRD